MKDLAKKAMTTKGQKGCKIIDHLVAALGGDPSSSIRRAIILLDIDENPHTTQADIMNRMDIGKSALNREIEWMFNYGCIMRQDSAEDARTKTLQTCGYSKNELDDALEYVEGGHKNLKFFLEKLITITKLEKPTLRDAKIIATLYDKGEADKQGVTGELYNGPNTTDNRAIKRLLDEGIIKEDDTL